MAINKEPDGLSAAFLALANTTRRAILARLASGDADVSELMKPFPLSQPTISKHLKVLERAGLIPRGRDAQRRPRTLVAAPLKSIDEWLEMYLALLGGEVRQPGRLPEQAGQEGETPWEDQITVGRD